MLALCFFAKCFDALDIFILVCVIQLLHQQLLTEMDSVEVCIVCYKSYLEVFKNNPSFCSLLGYFCWPC